MKKSERKQQLLIYNTHSCVSQAVPSAGPAGFFPRMGSGAAMPGTGEEEIESGMGVHPLSSG